MSRRKTTIAITTNSYPHPLVDADGETNPMATCCFVGQTVDPCFFDYGRSAYRCPYECTADDILTTDWPEPRWSNSTMR